MSEDSKPLSEALTDPQIASILEEYHLEPTAENIDLVRDSRRNTEKYLKQLEQGRPAEEILIEIQMNALHKN